MKVAIIGHGYCGQATEYLLEEYIVPTPEVLIHDPLKGFVIDLSLIHI